MERADPIFKLRLPDFMREKLAKEADANRRSLTAEILARLETSFSNTEERLTALESDSDEYKLRINELKDRLEILQEFVQRRLSRL